MSDFEQLDHAWEQAEQSRHAALLRQLKAEVREFRRQARIAVAPSLPVPKEQPPQPDPGLVKRVHS
ncbi:hypothetical protein H6F76_18405 [Leptolyngbya sp. FACHB-321]|uniref:hypothetical protein n=1 Tax=Leptolyngbya sp. FACHB-321 TaxID=2692807 RepID=UPI0016828D2A|nr:hypothetical protein [Leptolyngbya sp. FACHB-321]MBD2036981.1 hypothetical protein [Leptolyngbya sp. FACHB-321]